MLTNKLQCKPIEGHDLPLKELEKQLKGVKIGETQAELIEIEVMEYVPNEIKETDEILSMLLPNQLKKGTMNFIEVEDLRTITTLGINHPKSEK